jgi:hypothetical protein
MKKFRLLLMVAVCLVVSEHSSAQTNEILLWPKGAPGSEGKTGDEISRTADHGEHFLNNIHKPSITCYIPPAEKSSGRAKIVTISIVMPSMIFRNYKL